MISVVATDDEKLRCLRDVCAAFDRHDLDGGDELAVKSSFWKIRTPR